MGRGSKGKSQNESKNLHKRLKDWKLDNWFVTPALGNDLKATSPAPETLRMAQGATTFAEASVMARQRYASRVNSPMPIKPTFSLPNTPRNLSSASSADSLEALPCAELSAGSDLSYELPLSPGIEGDLSVSVMKNKINADDTAFSQD